MTTFRITSSPMCHAPSVIEWAINAYRSPERRMNILDGFVNRCGFPEALMLKLLSGEVSFRVVEDDVVFDVPN